ncbi:MAG: phosphodiester glycosidase family protein [Intestinibacter bartlettii]|uniref:phosphodiester glycosidase family protein n=1 Tax=Intestinibacter bartlettii TaxID=261299 RepID=UPI0026EA6F9B|nr:phosphodiester glycosidase family protein [Intestinibacter bartlettii]MDO5011183.1 phosphodiester glycosidase family protein [Intestinibacter bartlettii]
MFKRKYLFAILYSIFLVMMFTYNLLDTFVLENRYAIVEDSSETKQNSNSSENAKITDTSYEDDNISINIITKEYQNTMVYIADVQVNDSSYLKTALAKNSYGKNIKEKTSDMATDNNAILAINGDYYGFRNSGYVIRNSTLYRNNKSDDNNQDLVIYSDGSFEIINEANIDAEELINKSATQVLSFGPGLIEDGQITVDENTEVSMSKSSNPRTAIGCIDKNHYILVVSDGRTSESQGLSLYQLATVMKEYGCKTAYNLDGGGSSTMWFNGKVINNPTSGRTIEEREVSDIVYIGY